MSLSITSNAAAPKSENTQTTSKPRQDSRWMTKTLIGVLVVLGVVLAGYVGVDHRQTPNLAQTRRFAVCQGFPNSSFAISNREVDPKYRSEIVNSIVDGKPTMTVHPIRNQEHEGFCYNYALGKIFGKNFNLINLADATEIVQGYFIPVTKPQKGDLAVYYDDARAESSKPVHFGVFTSKEMVESKWGGNKVFTHSRFHVPEMYGNCIVPYRLNKESHLKRLFDFVNWLGSIHQCLNFV